MAMSINTTSFGHSMWHALLLLVITLTLLGGCAGSSNVKELAVRSVENEKLLASAHMDALTALENLVEQAAAVQKNLQSVFDAAEEVCKARVKAERLALLAKTERAEERSKNQFETKAWHLVFVQYPEQLEKDYYPKINKRIEEKETLKAEHEATLAAGSNSVSVQQKIDRLNEQINVLKQKSMLDEFELRDNLVEKIEGKRKEIYAFIDQQYGRVTGSLSSFNDSLCIKQKIEFDNVAVITKEVVRHQGYARQLHDNQLQALQTIERYVGRPSIPDLVVGGATNAASGLVSGVLEDVAGEAIKLTEQATASIGGFDIKITDRINRILGHMNTTSSKVTRKIDDLVKDLTHETQINNIETSSGETNK